MRTFTIALLLFSLLALAVASNITSDGRARTLRFFKTPTTVGVKAVAVTKVGGQFELDAILAGATLLPFPTMAFSYFTAEADAAEDIATFSSGRFSFAYRFVGIIEYEENGATDGFQHDEDTVVSYYTFRKRAIDWEGSTSTEEDGVLVARVVSKDGVVGFTLAFAGDRAAFENRTLNGDNFKFGVTLNYGKADSYSGRTDTSIALVTLAGSKKTIKSIERTQDVADNGFDVPSDDAAIAGRLVWDTVIHANKTGTKAIVNIVTTVDSTLRNDTVALNITTGWAAKVVYHAISLNNSMTVGNTELYWDPELAADIDYEALDATPSTTTPGTRAPTSRSSDSTAVVTSIAVVISAAVALFA